MWSLFRRKHHRADVVPTVAAPTHLVLYNVEWITSSMYSRQAITGRSPTITARRLLKRLDSLAVELYEVSRA